MALCVNGNRKLHIFVTIRRAHEVFATINGERRRWLLWRVRMFPRLASRLQASELRAPFNLTATPNCSLIYVNASARNSRLTVGPT